MVSRVIGDVYIATFPLANETRGYLDVPVP